MTRVTPKLKDLSCRERFHNLGLTTLERRRERGDLIRWYKINAKINKVTYVGPIMKAPRCGHRERLCKEAKLKCVQRTNFLTNRVVNKCNKLDDSTVQAPTTNSFKNLVDTDHNGYYSSIEVALH